jgi:uncharacterized protein
MAHPVLKFQILSTDADASAKFYAELFGWTINADNPLGYREIDTKCGDGIQGGIWPAPQQSHDFVQLFVHADDVAASIKRAEQLGAALLIPLTTLPGGEQMAVLKDPRGLPSVIWRAA